MELGGFYFIVYYYNEEENMNTEKDYIVEIQEETRIPQSDSEIILERGDRIQILESDEGFTSIMDFFTRANNRDITIDSTNTITSMSISAIVKGSYSKFNGVTMDIEDSNRTFFIAIPVVDLRELMVKPKYIKFKCKDNTVFSISIR